MKLKQSTLRITCVIYFFSFEMIHFFTLFLIFLMFVVIWYFLFKCNSIKLALFLQVFVVFVVTFIVIGFVVVVIVDCLLLFLAIAWLFVWLLVEVIEQEIEENGVWHCEAHRPSWVSTIVPQQLRCVNESHTELDLS